MLLAESFIYKKVLTTINIIDKRISWYFTLNIKGHIETTKPTHICIKFLVDLAGLFNWTLRISANPRTENIPKNIRAKSVQSVMI